MISVDELLGDEMIHGSPAGRVGGNRSPATSTVGTHNMPLINVSQNAIDAYFRHMLPDMKEAFLKSPKLAAYTPDKKEQAWATFLPRLKDYIYTKPGPRRAAASYAEEQRGGESMNIKEIAAKLTEMRETRMTAFIMSGQLREELGFDGYAEALRRRWIQADEDMSGMIQVSNNLGVIAEMKALALEYAEESAKPCMMCHKDGKGCTCTKCKDCGKANCTCESLRESAILSVAHANRTKQTLAEIATYGLGRQPDNVGSPIVGLGAQSAQPASPASPAPIQRPNPSASPANPQVMGVGADVSIVQDGKTYVGKVSQVKPDGKMQISFGGEKPSAVRDYDKSEVAPLADANK